MDKATARPMEPHEMRDAVSDVVERISMDTGESLNEIIIYIAECYECNWMILADSFSKYACLAVNSQDALVNACKDAFTMIGEGMIDNCLTDEELPEWQALQDKLFKAITLAKGEQS